jgi:putative NADH-flavin reductase
VAQTDNRVDLMKVTILGATGLLGKQCVREALEAGHEITVLVRDPGKLSDAVRSKVRVLQGDALDAGAIDRALEGGTEGVLFAIGVDKASPEDLCTDVTRHVLEAMPRLNVKRFVWCGGGSNIVEGDVVSLGARFVEFFASTFMGLRHRDKTHQLELLAEHPEIDWYGVRPLQMRDGSKKGEYRIGFNAFSGMSQISAADCAHAMVGMLSDDTWLRRAPIIQY